MIVLHFKLSRVTERGYGESTWRVSCADVRRFTERQLRCRYHLRLGRSHFIQWLVSGVLESWRVIFSECDASRDGRRLHELTAAVRKVDSEYNNYTVSESSLDYVPDLSTVQVIQALYAAEDTANLRRVVGFVDFEGFGNRADAAIGRQTLSRAQQKARQRVQAKVVPVSPH